MLLAASCAFFSAEPPQIVIGPEEISETDAGNNIVLTCIAHGNANPSMSWNRGGILLSNGSRHTIYEQVVTKSGVDFVMAILEICSTKPEDAGEYSCTALNSAGSDNYTFELSVSQEGKFNCQFVINLSSDDSISFLAQ